MKPLISVALLEFIAPRVFVGGQVGKPGSYQLRDSQTLVQAIFLAGGFTAGGEPQNRFARASRRAERRMADSDD